MGWAMLIGVALLTGGLLWLIGFPRRLWMVAATALTLGATGYAWQGNPGMPGHPVSQAEAPIELDPELIALRSAMFGSYGTFAWGYLSAADGMTRSGSPAYAVNVLLGGVAKGPQEVALWTGLGTALSENDKGVSPAARFAFDKAMALNPKHPGPPFFLGLAYIRAGQFAEARQYWALAAQLAPAGAPYREDLNTRLGLLDRFLEDQAARQQQMQAAPPNQ